MDVTVAFKITSIACCQSGTATANMSQNFVAPSKSPQKFPSGEGSRDAGVIKSRKNKSNSVSIVAGNDGKQAKVVRIL